MADLILIIGLPGSGKSTLAKMLAQERRQIVSTDAIRSQLFGHEAIQGSWQLIQQEVERQLRDCAAAIQQGNLQAAIYDATNTARKQRRQAIRQVRQWGFDHVTGLWLNVPLEECLLRNYQRDRQVPEEVIQRMHRRLLGAPPHCQDGFNQLIEIQACGTKVAILSRHCFNASGSGIDLDGCKKLLAKMKAISCSI